MLINPNANNFTTTLFDLFDRLATQQLLVAITIWNLWKSCNTKLWEATNTSPSSIVTWDVHNEDHDHSYTEPELDTWSNVMWTPPFPTKNLSWGAMCFWNSTWLLLLSKSDHSYSSTTALEAEVIVLLEAIKVAISNGMHVVWFETDFKTLSHGLATNNLPLNEFGDPVSQCRSFIFNRNYFIVS